MSAKKVAFGSRPQARPEPAPDAEQWVESRTAAEQQQRIDVRRAGELAPTGDEGLRPAQGDDP